MLHMIAGYLEVGCDERGEIVINHPSLLVDENGVGHIVFSPDQARNLAKLLLRHANRECGCNEATNARYYRLFCAGAQ